MPVCEGLFGEWDNIVQDLLYALAVWHALAKMRLHFEWSLRHLAQATRNLGFALRIFVRDLCNAHTTHETERERLARVERAQRKGKNANQTGRKERRFNLSTYKLHALGDYVRYIQLFGTSDGWSTQTVSTLLNSALSTCSPHTGRTRTQPREALLSPHQQGTHLRWSDDTPSAPRRADAPDPRASRCCKW
jgi:hypothetical protein